MKNKILVIGGTGTVGSKVVGELKHGNANYVVLTRKKEKAEELSATGIPTVVGRLGEWATIQPIMAGVDTIFLLTNPSEEMLNLHKGLIDMAVKNGVKKIVRQSGEPASYSEGTSLYGQHAEADEYLKQSGLEYVILRPHYFMQNIIFQADFIKSQNMFTQYLGEAQIPMIDVRDIAKAAFQALTKNDFNNKTFVLTGPRSISFGDVAKALSSVLGRKINYVSMSYEEQKAGFKMAGLPDWQIEGIMKVLKTWVDRGKSDPSNDFETITHSKATNVEKFAEDHVQFFK